MTLSQLLPIFTTFTKSQEILLLLQDAKPVVRQGFYPSEIPKIQQFCRKQGLSLVISKFKVLLAEGKKVAEGGKKPAEGEKEYSNQGLRVPETDSRPGMYFLYFSKEEKKALLAAYYEQIGNDLDLGRILGYPECCVEFFVKQFSPEHPDLQHPPTNPYTNLSKRNQDFVLLSHFPCSSECAESIHLARKYLEAITAVDPGRARELFSRLQVS